MIIFKKDQLSNCVQYIVSVGPVIEFLHCCIFRWTFKDNFLLARIIFIKKYNLLTYSNFQFYKIMPNFFRLDILSRCNIFLGVCMCSFSLKSNYFWSPPPPKKKKSRNSITWLTLVSSAIPLKSTDVGCPLQATFLFLPVAADARNRCPPRAIYILHTYM